MQRAANRKCLDLMANCIWVGMREGSGRLLPGFWLGHLVLHSRTRGSFGRYKVNLEF